MTQIPNDTPHYDGADSQNAKEYDITSYQDTIDVNPDKTDPLMHELNDDPVVMFGVPSDELRDEMDKRDLESADTTDDMRSEIEDFDDGQGQRD